MLIFDLQLTQLLEMINLTPHFRCFWKQKKPETIVRALICTEGGT